VTETWRKKRYYRPRILLSQNSVLDPTPNEILVCLDGAELAMLRTLLGYAQRRVTWVSEYRQTDYLTPTNEDFDAIQAIVSNLEDKLMTGMCEELNASLQDINTTLAENGTTLENIVTALGTIDATLLDIVTPLECLCAKSEQTLINVVVSPNWPEYPNADDVFEWGNELPNTSVGGQGATDACNLAQCWYQATLEWMTEVILPAIRFGFDKVIPAAAAAVAVWSGGLAWPAAMGVYALAELLQELLEVAYDGAEENLVNWMYAQKEDVVCLLYTGLQSGGSGSGLWAAVKNELVDPAGDLSAGDKLLLNWTGQTVGLWAAEIAKQQNSDWYQSVPTAGFCDDCEEPPIIGSDWWALPIPAEDGEFTINHPSGGYWQPYCWNYDLPDGEQLVGMVYEIVAETGDCELSRNSSSTCGCAYPELWPNSSGDSTLGDWFAYTPYEFNNTEARAQLCPTSGTWTNLTSRTGIVVSAGFRTGWNCTGSVDIKVKYLVFKGTTPP
jgi:hypothetical protein